MTNLPAIALTPDAQGRPTCLSTDVALHFQKKHSHVLRDIDRIRSMCPVAFFESNFGFKEMETPVGFGIRKDRAFRLTRDAFSLLVMGMTGPAAIRWKLRYIEAFNAMERELAERQDAGTGKRRRKSENMFSDREFYAGTAPDFRAGEKGRS